MAGTTDNKSFLKEAKIVVVGVGGGGGNAVNRMMQADLRGIKFVAINTDSQALEANAAPQKIQIGETVTRGLGTGGNPEIGTKAAEESEEAIYETLKDADMVFLAAGMGGGTGTGASPVVARIAKEQKALTIAVVTKPFTFEGKIRMKNAELGLSNLIDKVDTLITIPNDRILEVVEKKMGIEEAFKIADDVLRQGIQGISEVVTVPGLVNRDFADVKTIMQDA